MVASRYSPTFTVTEKEEDMKTQTLLSFGALLVASAIPLRSFALPPSPAFQGKVIDIFMNDASVLVQVEGGVQGPCTGSFANYNLTVDFTDAQAQTKLNLIRDAFLNGKIIAGYVSGCSSSNLNKLTQVAIANPQ